MKKEHGKERAMLYASFLHNYDELLEMVGISSNVFVML